MAPGKRSCADPPIAVFVSTGVLLLSAREGAMLGAVPDAGAAVLRLSC